MRSGQRHFCVRSIAFLLRSGLVVMSRAQAEPNSVQGRGKENKDSGILQAGWPDVAHSPVPLRRRQINSF